MASVTDRPWQQLPGEYTTFHGEYDHARRDGPPRQQAYVVEAGVGDTLYESSDGVFVAEEQVHPRQDTSSHVQCTRRCCSFTPEPNASGSSVVQSAFRTCHQAAHTIVRPCATAPPTAGPLGYLRRWGIVGEALASLMEDKSMSAWAHVEHLVFVLLWRFVAHLWLLLCHWFSQLTGRGGGAHFIGGGSGIQGEQLRPQPCIAWHPHRDVFATISSSGQVAVHSMGDAFAGTSTQYMHLHGNVDAPLCLSWQPNDLRGAFALGTSGGVEVWRRSHSDGWWCAWALRGEPFKSPAVSWSPDGRCLASGSVGGVVRVWPHTELFAEQLAPWCITLRRLGSAAVSSVQWCPDGTLLAVAHGALGETRVLIRLWDTRSWEMSARVDLRCLPLVSPVSLAWCSNETLLASAAAQGGQLLELCGLGEGGGGWAAGSDPLSRMLPVPQVREPSRGAAADGCAGQVAEVAVCPRTSQRIAVRLVNSPRVLIFERLGTGGWVKQELVVRGLVQATGQGTAPTPLPRALAFAAGTPGEARRLGQQQQGGSAPLIEGSLLAVYWDFGDHGAEVRTYPLYFLPYRLMQCDKNVIFD